MKEPLQGSELHRLTEMKPYDPKTFNKLYKMCKPVIRSLTKNIDHRRLNVTPDIITSYFWDKFIFVFNKYQDKYEYEQLKANILTSLKSYSFKLMRVGYSQASDLNQSLVSLDTLFDDSMVDIIPDNKEDGNIYQELLDNYMMNNLSEDEYLLYQTQLNPPPFFSKLIEEAGGKLTILHLIDFFEFERSRGSYKYFSNLRNNIQITLEKAKAELN